MCLAPELRNGADLRRMDEPACPISGRHREGKSRASGVTRFASAANRKALLEGGTFDATCPRNPKELRERMKEKRFASMQRRRGQTEARISIFKRGFLGRPMRAKGFEHRQLDELVHQNGPLLTHQVQRGLGGHQILLLESGLLGVSHRLDPSLDLARPPEHEPDHQCV